jgi:hypothetical protein
MEKNENVTLENHKKEKELGMGWHDFMVFCRGFTGVTGIIGGGFTVILSYLTGHLFGVLMGMAAIGLGIYSFEVRSDLKNLEEDAPKNLIRYHVFIMIMGIVDAFADFFMGPLTSYDKVDTRSLMSAIIHGIIMITINSIYYEKRRHMFEDGEEE